MYEQVEKATGKRPPELDVEPRPDELEPLWEAFADLRRQHLPDESIKHGEMLAYGELMGRKFRPLEVRAICDLDAAWHRERAKWRTS